MKFEDEVKQYLVGLCVNNTFISGNLVGLNNPTAKAKVSVVTGDNISEKFIMIYKENSAYTWKYLNIMNNKPIYRQVPGNWEYPTLAKRIVASVDLVLQYPQFEIWFRINDLPISRQDNTIYCYFNVVLPEHQQLFDQLVLAGSITIENNPSIIIQTTTTTTV